MSTPDLRTCAEHCGEIRKPTEQEYKDFLDRYNWHDKELGFCGWCRNGQNEWFPTNLLFDIENDFMVTPCCHAEAVAAFFSYEKDS